MYVHTMYYVCVHVHVCMDGCVYSNVPGTFGYKTAVLHTLLGPVPVPVQKQGTVYRVVVVVVVGGGDWIRTTVCTGWDRLHVAVAVLGCISDPNFRDCSLSCT